MLNDILTLNIFSFMLIFARIGTALSIMPGFNAPFVTSRARLIFALAISFVLTPVLSAVIPALPKSSAELFVLVASEMLVGAFIGTVVRILMGALQTTGTLISYFSSMANAFVHDPISEQQSATLSGFLGVMGLTLIFVTNLHHLLLQGITESYQVFIPGAKIMAHDIADYLASRVMESFELGLKITAPFFIVGVSYYLGLGLLSRLMPQLQVFFVGLPVQIALQLSIFMIALSAMMTVFMEYFRDTYSAMFLS